VLTAGIDTCFERAHRLQCDPVVLSMTPIPKFMGAWHLALQLGIEAYCEYHNKAVQNAILSLYLPLF
jgi:hypothetical protein